MTALAASGCCSAVRTPGPYVTAGEESARKGTAPKRPNTSGANGASRRPEPSAALGVATTAMQDEMQGQVPQWVGKKRCRGARFVRSSIYQEYR